MSNIVILLYVIKIVSNNIFMHWRRNGSKWRFYYNVQRGFSTSISSLSRAFLPSADLTHGKDVCRVPDETHR
jgi:hypothetical protein